MNKWKRICCSMLASVAILSGCGQSDGMLESSDGADIPLTAANVRWVYMTRPIPSSDVSSPLIGSRDEDRIAELLQWVKEAKRVDGTGLTSPVHGRSMAVNVEFNDERLLQIRPAWTCDSHKDEQGNIQTSSKGVANRVQIWEKQVKVKDAEWVVKGIVPDNLEAGNYDWKINTGTATYGVSVLITN
ncbi:hypothetical protein RB620_15305 [Paenibacillus sp. LHD-117]|uniref:hypothetical protein n=1 Tax=Paenibacillus sp. LHD-117 TaxID=3071412 RepID=UPI0027E1190C|nr:hypothetical protein [Paenibacillus sp. LHD-117]MDQ6420796.1 hypothetical protein [Paenibacillus sp. LHD-117]